MDLSQESNKKNNIYRIWSIPIIGLLCNPPKCKTTLSCLWHDTNNYKRCVILVRTKGPQHRRRALLYGFPEIQEHIIDKQRCTHSIKNNEKCDGISGKRRSWSSFSQFLGIRTYLYHPPWNGPHTASGTHENWKFHCKRHFKQYIVPKTIKIHGYVLLLDSILNQARIFPCLLETRNWKPGRLVYQASTAL